MDEEILYEPEIEESTDLYENPILVNSEDLTNKYLQEKIEENSLKNKAEALKRNVDTYQNNRKNKNLSNDLKNNSTSGLNSSSTNNVNRTNNSGGAVSDAATKLVSKTMQSKGLPPEVAQKMAESQLAQKAIQNAVNSNPLTKGIEETTKNKKTTTEEDANVDSATGSSKKILIIGAAIIGGGIIGMMLLLMLVMILPQIYIKSLGLGFAEDVASELAEEKLTEYMNDMLGYEGIGDTGEEYASSGELSDFAKQKLSNASLVSKIFIKRKYQEADLAELKEFYGSSIFNIESDDMYIVYTFYFKLYDIYTRYSDKYGVSLDLPLIMATLYEQSEDMDVVFKSNAEDYKRINLTSTDVTELDFEYDLSSYKPTKKKSEHDIELLAQGMIVNANGTYKMKSKKEYKTYLKEFIKTKYGVSDDEARSRVNYIYEFKDMYEWLAGGKTETKAEIYNTVGNDAWWWPIGSRETTEVNGKTFATGEPEFIHITSYYGMRNLGGDTSAFHHGIDIKGIYRQTNVIATRAGVVIRAKDGYKDDNKNIDNCSTANYVVIQHDDGTYSKYWHLAKGSVNKYVTVGTRVEQGQVIGQTASSGCSTGTHLHFQLEDASGTSFNPLDVVSTENPRPISTNSSLLSFLHSWEGTPQAEGDDYIVFDDGAGNLTVGWGIALKWNGDRFKEYGIDVTNYKLGSKIPINIVDNIESQILAENMEYVLNVLAEASITLKEYQIDALVSRKYNFNINGFTAAYKEYGNTQALYDNFMNKPVTSNGKYLRGLVRRREAEWNLFHNGVYEHN